MTFVSGIILPLSQYGESGGIFQKKHSSHNKMFFGINKIGTKMVFARMDCGEELYPHFKNPS